jgi:uncharacterized repeat protein (TIGR01451 family)
MSEKTDLQPRSPIQRGLPRVAKSMAIILLTFGFLAGVSAMVFAGKSTIGDFIWLDYNQNDLKDDGPTGINGVEVRVYKDDGDGIFSPTIDALIAISMTINEPPGADGDNTLTGEPGFYDISVDDGGHWVHLPASNFAPGGPLEGYTYTGSGIVLPDGSVVLFRNVPLLSDVDDADFGFAPLDWGDLPDDDATPGDDSPFSAGYNTNSTGVAGPSHVIVPGLRIGASVDAETDGQPNPTATGDDIARTPDDEDGVILPSVAMVGQTATFTVTVVNTRGVPAILYGFVDWNGDGDFLDSVEVLTITIPSSLGGTTATFNYGVPATANLSQRVGVRFRLSTDTGLGADGPATNGEVEDYLLQVIGYDWGDLPDGNATTSPNYHTDSTGAFVGPSHLITSTLRLGASVDAERDGQPTATANGDDIFTSDDEDSIAAFPQFVAGSSTVITLSAFNNTGSAATLYAFIDWNADGDFDDLNEQTAVAVPNGTNGPIAVTVSVPLTTATSSNLGARFRLSTDNGLGPYGPASDGEVEDYLIRVDYFDLAMRKRLSGPLGPIYPGSMVTYTITIFNQGTMTARNIQVTDYISSSFLFTPNNGWVAGPPNQVVTTIAGPLAPGAAITRTLVLQVASNYYGSQLTNMAEISAADDDGDPNTPPPTDVDSTPDNDPTNDGTPKDDVIDEDHKNNPNDDEDDSDTGPTPISHIRDLAIEKIAQMAEARPGQLVTFTIVITNEGTLPATNIQVTDTFTNAFQVPVPNALNTANGWTGTNSPLVTTVAGPLNPGATTTLQVVLRVDPAYRGSRLTNTASVPPDDNPPNEPPDDDDNSEVPVRFFDLALIKRANPGIVEPGQTVTFTIELYNQGTLPAYNIQVSDYITGAFVFTPSVPLNSGWMASTNQLTKTIPGPLAPGMMTTTHLVLQVPSSYTTTSTIANIAEISAADDDTNPNNPPPTDVDSTPDSDRTNDGPMTDNVINNTNGDEDDSDPAFVEVRYTPTAVQLAQFAVRKMTDSVEVSWQSVSEAEIMGFHIWRQVNGGRLERVTKAVLAAQKPGQTAGASYRWMDSAASDQFTIYVLEVLLNDGQADYIILGSATPGAQLFMPVIVGRR